MKVNHEEAIAYFEKIGRTELRFAKAALPRSWEFEQSMKIAQYCKLAIDAIRNADEVASQMERETPKTPQIRTVFSYDTKMQIAVCPVCKFKIDRYKDHYCRHCGQTIETVEKGKANGKKEASVSQAET